MIFNIFGKKGDDRNCPEYWTEYLSAFSDNPTKDKLITETQFVALDIESSGLDAKKDKILSIGAVKIKNNQILAENAFEVFVEQSQHNPETVPIHGIRKNGDLNKITEQDAIVKILSFIKNNIIVGHSVSFDIKILNETLKKYSGDNLKNQTVDTVNLYKRYKGADLKEGESLSLDSLSDDFNISKSDRHSAAGDALITAILFLKLTSRLNKRGINTVKELLREKRTLL